MLYYILIIFLIFSCFKLEAFNQPYIHGQTLSNDNKIISQQDVIDNPSNTQEYEPKRYFDYIIKPSIHIDSLEDILKSLSNPNIYLIDLEYIYRKPFYDFIKINKILEDKINKLSGPLGVFKILDNVGYIYQGLDIDFMEITFNLYNISRSSATPVICYIYKIKGNFIIKEIKFNFTKQPKNIITNKQIDNKTDKYNFITYPSSIKIKINQYLNDENKKLNEYKTKNDKFLQNNINNDFIIHNSNNDLLEYSDLGNTTDIKGLLQSWYNNQ